MPTFLKLLQGLLRLTRVRRRGALIAWTLTFQAVVLGLGLLVVFSDLRHRLAMSMSDKILAHNVKTAEGLAETLEALDLGPATCGSVACERAQTMIEHLSLPAGAFVCLLDEGDRIICHPDLRERPTLCGTDLHGMEVAAGGKVVRLGESDRKEMIAGRASFLRNGTHYIAARYIPDMKARLLVQQPESGLLALREAATSGAMVRAGGLALALLSLTGGISVVLIRKHDNTLESINKGLEAEVERRVGENLIARHALIFGLAKLADYRDTDTGQHLERICTYSELLARDLMLERPEIDEGWIANLKLAASLHDIGKVGIPDTVLLKPGKLNAAEREIIERHPIIGADTLLAIRQRLGDSELVNMGIQVALSHHERWDGTGYPYGFKGEHIPLAARIVSLADVYDALTSERVYKAAMSHKEAVTTILKGSGDQFDPSVVASFLRTAGQFDEHRRRMQPVREEAKKAA